jgi:oligopeptide transport system substrate-binding protein
VTGKLFSLWMTVTGLGCLLAYGTGCAGGDDGEHFGTTDRAGKSPHTFYVNNHDEPEYLDPGLSTESAGTALLSDLFEGLVVLHPETLMPHQGMATSWDQSDDNRIFRFHLRKEAKWSDGKPLTSADFVYAWRRVLNSKTGARMATLMYPIKNGKLFHQGRLKVLQRDVSLRGGPKLKAGVSVQILKTSSVTSLRLPFGAAMKAGAELSYDIKSGKMLKGSEPVAGETVKEAYVATVVGIGAKTKCNEAPDHWYEVQSERGTGWLPGCALAADKKSKEALIEVFTDLPTFRPPKPAAPVEAPPKEAPPAEAPPEPAPARGFVALDALKLDPSVLGVRSVGDHVVEVELQESTAYFLELVAYVTYYPVRQDLIEHFEKEGRADLWYRPENIITNGPFVLDEHKFRYEITFKRNPHYYDHDKLKLHRVVWFEVPDYNATLALYKTGELDYIGQNVSLPSAQMHRLESFADFSRSDWLATYWYEFNVDKPPVNDRNVRHALNLAVNKQLVIDKVTRAGQQVATHFVPDYTGMGYSKIAAAEKKAGNKRFAGKGYDYDPEHARELLRKAGYEVVERDGGWHAPKFPALEILYNTSEGHRKIAVAIQDMWKTNLGITVQLRNEEWKVMLKNLRDGHFQVARFGWVADYNHPHTWLDIFLSYSNNNWTHWADPKYDALVEKAAATADPDESIRLYRDAESMAVESMSRMPLYFYTKSTLVKPYVKGYYPNGANRHRVRWMWIDQDWKNNKTNVPAYPPRELPKPGTIVWEAAARDTGARDTGAP